MEDDWDLHAVVRECAAVFAAASNPPPSQNSFTFTGLLDDETNNKDPLVGLQEIYQDFCLDDLPPPATVIAAPATIPAAHVFQEIAQMEPPPPPPLQMNLQIQENVQLHNPITLPPPPQIFPAAIPQPTRRRRKNQHLKMVRQMTQEELSADSWAWRKYGQKPIKGSSFPRNYYRCSTSKGCAARKQVERSQNDPGIFVVSYTGDHTHPRPTHRNSLAGSTRPKFSSPQRNTINNALLFKTGSVSSSSAATGSSFSPSTPSMEAEAASQNDDVEMAEDDDMFKGFHVDSDDHDSGGGDLFSGCLLSSPPWSPPPELP